MPVREYLKSVASNLRRAAEARSHEIDELRSNLAAQEQRTKIQMAELDQKIQNKNYQLMQSDLPPQEKAETAQEIRELRKEKSQVENELKQVKRETDQAMQQKSSDVSDFNSQANQYESLAGSAD